MNGIKIGENIRVLRGSKGVSQETLADVCGVSMQAVSKWENGQCYPDITFLPILATYFQVTLDFLMTGKEMGKDDGEKSVDGRIRDMLEDKTKENVLYIVQYRNGKIIDKKCFDSELPQRKKEPVKVMFDTEFQSAKNGLVVEIWGNADISGDVYGCVNAGGMVNCGEVNGCVNAGGAVKCEEINGGASAGGSITCEEVNGSVAAGGTVNCEEVSGDVSAGGDVSCWDVGGDVTAGGEVQCKNIRGDAKAGLSVVCSSVDGEIEEGVKE